MCGIAGIFSSQEVSASVSRMTKAISHRGPDDAGQSSLSDAGGNRRGEFGHRRLAILDLTSAGHQPMSTPDGRYCVTYNGEIFNFPELRHALEKEGAVFRTNCDTEAIILGWAIHGPAFLARLRGMFALALWDRKLGCGYLARDAFGIKPLYFAAVGGSVLFGSEVRALLESESVPRVLSPSGLTSFLSTGSVAEPFTIVDGVMAVPAGNVLEVTFDGRSAMVGKRHQFSEAFPTDEEEVESFAQSALQLRDALRDSVRHHLLSDVPVAMFLSGGLDSSAMVGIASEVSDHRPETFTVSFAEAEYSEGELGRLVAERFSTSHHDVRLSANDLLAALPAAFAAMDQPSLDGLNTFIVSRAVRSFGLKVALSGIGGDELFAGYPSFRRAAGLAPFWRLPSKIRQVSAFAASGIAGIRGEKASLLMGSDAPAEGAYRASRTLFGERQGRRLLDERLRGVVQPNAVPDHPAQGISLLRQVTIQELTGYMRNTLLRDGDVFSMANGLELRVPFLDPAVVRVAARAADSSKLRGSSSKPLLVKAVSDLLPPELMSQPKRGFTLPFEKWLRSDLRKEVDAVFSLHNAEQAGLSGVEARQVWTEFERRRPGVTWSRPWALYTLIRWTRENNFSPPESLGAKPTSLQLN